MSSVVISGDTSGQVTLAAPAVAGSNTITLPASTGTAQLIGQGTAVASTSGTSIDFISIPSWVKRITVMLSGVSTNGAGSASILIQIGAGSIQSTGYLSYAGIFNGSNQTSTTSSTAGMLATTAMGAVSTHNGAVVLLNISGNIWVASGAGAGLDGSSNTVPRLSGGTVTLSGTLDRVRITTTNGTDAFDAGSVNILYEG